MIRNEDITVVFQGALPPYDPGVPGSVEKNMDRTRAALPGCRFILSTWDGERPVAIPYLDALVHSPDPGPLPTLKKTDGHPNNLNRQILSTQRGLALVKTPFAIKMRTDARLETDGFLKTLEILFPDETWKSRFLIPSFFSIDPFLFERVPYHLSDWMQFGQTDLLRRLWNVLPMTDADACYYDLHPHSSKARYFEKKFRAKFAAEQYIYAAFAAKEGFAVPHHLADDTPDILQDFKRFLKEKTVILPPKQIGLVVPRYERADTHFFQRWNCLSYEDWLFYALPAIARKSLKIQLRHCEKILLRFLFWTLAPFHTALATLWHAKRRITPPRSE